jgi:hypothetical protein
LLVFIPSVLDLVTIHIDSGQVVNYSLSHLKASIYISRREVLSSLSFSVSVDIDYFVILRLEVVRIPLEFALYL